MDDFDTMLKLYPEMILTSRFPPSWKGLLTITDNRANCKIKVKVKLVVPSFPRLDGTSIQFGGSIASLFGLNFKKRIESILARSESVPDFIQELTSVIVKSMSENQEAKFSNFSFQLGAREKVLEELNHVLSEFSCVEFSSTKNLNAIKLTMNDVSIIVKLTVNTVGQNSWKVVSSDLPALPAYTFQENKCSSLKEIENLFQRQVDILENVWEQLRRIDNYCYVVDPIHPKPYHLYRRIYLSSSLSCLLTLNPMDPTGYPIIKFFGVLNEVEKYRNIIQDEDAIKNWDLDYSVYENLLILLKIDEFPEAPKVDNLTDGGMVGDEECCICFAIELEDSTLPNEICNNEKCRRHYHSICLFQWLQELAANKIVFNKIFGPCPNCEMEISCNIPSN